MDFSILAIIIGFEYKSGSNMNSHHADNSANNEFLSNFLPGIIVDLNQAYNFALKSNPNKIIIITDVEEDKKWYEIFYAIRDNTVDMSALKFIETIKQLKIYYRYKNKNDLLELLKKYVAGFDRIFFYYTGHGSIIHKNNFEEINVIELPQVISTAVVSNMPIDVGYSLNEPPSNGDFIYINELCDIFFNGLKTSEYLFIFDCCHATNMNLAYGYDYEQDIFKLNKKEINSDGKNITLRPYKFYKNNIICLSGSPAINNLSKLRDIASNSGSLFTKLLFKILNDRRRSFKSISDAMMNPEDVEYFHNSLKDEISIGQQINISSPFPNMAEIYSWLYGFEKKHKIIIDHENNVIRVVKNV